MTLLRIAILGAESSGKSTLAEALARRYGTLWVPEYLREFVETRFRVPHEDEQIEVARTQLAREEAALVAARRYLFCDTTPLITALYSRYCFGRPDAGVEALAAAHRYDLTLVAAPDIPWIADGLQRDSEAARLAIHDQLLRELDARAIAYTLVEGELDQRLAQVDGILSRLG